jgi:hypothetical protein
LDDRAEHASVSNRHRRPEQQQRATSNDSLHRVVTAGSNAAEDYR